jgi:hypothetical protein
VEIQSTVLLQESWGHFSKQDAIQDIPINWSEQVMESDGVLKASKGFMYPETNFRKQWELFITT